MIREGLVRGIYAPVLVALGLLSLAGCGGWLRHPSDQIEAHLLGETPLATAKELVRTLSQERARDITEDARLTPNPSNYPVPASEGSSYLRAHLGSYGFVFRVDVVAFYVFDANDQLVAIHVRKDTDAP